MLSRSIFLLRDSSAIQLREIKPFLSRHLASLTKQSNKRRFPPQLKRHSRRLLFMTLIGIGSFYGYRAYRHYQWYNEIANSDQTLGTKHRIVVLGTGWAAIPVLKHIDTQKYEVVCVSPRNFFLMTSLLPSASVGTLETRTVVEPVRSLIGPRIKYIEAECVDIDPKSKVITCSSEGQKLVISTDPASITKGGSSSTEILDSARTRPNFDMKYDTLVFAVGSQTNTFNTPGVEKHAHFLKEILDARRIRAAISDAFESAMIPSQTDEERKRLLHFVVVGGGPTGVEFAAELADYIHEDLHYYFPRLVANDVKISLIQSLDHILSTMDKKISDYTEKQFHRENIEVLTNTLVKAVKQREVVIQKKGSDELSSIPCSVVIWATGIKARPLTNRLREIIGPKFQNNRMGLVTDKYLRVKGIEDGSIYALGDCATIEQPKLLDRLQLLFEEVDKERNGFLDLQEFQMLVERKIDEFPQLEIFSKGVEKAFYEADKDKSGQLSLAELRFALEKADQKLRALPATAQVAAQEGRYVANLLNQIAISHKDTPKPFQYKHMGSLAYVGGDSAVLDFTGSKPFLDILNLKPLSGRSAAYLWKSFYLTEMFTGRTKILLAFDWVRTRVFGRDISRY